jgi:hypothetical protein
VPDSSILEFVSSLRAAYGEDRVEPYGSANPDEEHGFGFRIRGVPAIFSVITLSGSLPKGRYDVQIESDPPGEYLFTEALNTDELLKTIQRVVDGERP